jgi:Fe-S cluster biogenesis protein NfuA
MDVERLEQRIERALDLARPYLRADGGDVQIVRVKPGGILEVRWVGTCVGCPMSQLTLRAGVERAVLKEVPEIVRVEAVSA